MKLTKYNVSKNDFNKYVHKLSYTYELYPNFPNAKNSIERRLYQYKEFKTNDELEVEIQKLKTENKFLSDKNIELQMELCNLNNLQWFEYIEIAINKFKEDLKRIFKQ